MAFSKEDQQHWISVADGMVVEFLAAREQAALAIRETAPTATTAKPQPKRAAAPVVQAR